MSRDRSRNVPRSRFSVLLSLVLLALVAGSLAAQEPARQDLGSDADARAEILAELEERFEILGLRQGGFVLEPRAADAGFRSIEVAPDGVWVDGEPIDREALRALIDADARRVFALTALDDPLLEAVPPVEAPSIGTVPPVAPVPPLEAPRPGETPEDVERRLEEIDERLERRLEEIERQAERAREEAESRRERYEEEAERARRRVRDRLEEAEERLEESRQERRERERDAGRESLHRRDGRIAIMSGVTVEADESVEEVVSILGAVDIEGRVEGDAAVVLDSMRVSGRVDGDVAVIGGDLSLEDGAYVGGDVAVIGGDLSRDSGSTVRGEITSVDAGDVDWGEVVWDGDDHHHHDDGGWGEFSWGDLFYYLFELLFLALIVVCTLFLAEPAVRRTGERARLEPWKAGLVGLVAQVAFILIAILLTVSCIGIPLLFLLFVALAIVLVLGFAGVVLILGDWLRRRFSLGARSAYMSAFFGLLLVNGWMILGELLSWIPWPLKFAIVLAMIFGFLVKYAAWTVGLGAVLLDQFSPLTAPGAALPAYGGPPPVPPPAGPAPAVLPDAGAVYDPVDPYDADPYGTDPSDGDPSDDAYDDRLESDRSGVEPFDDDPSRPLDRFDAEPIEPATDDPAPDEPSIDEPPVDDDSTRR